MRAAENKGWRIRETIVGGGEDIFANVSIRENMDYFGLLFQDIEGSHVTNRLFRRSLIGNKRFPQSKTIEDMRFMRLILDGTQKEVYTTEQLYFYTVREDSTSFVYAKTFVNSYERAKEFQSRYYEAKEKYPQYKEMLLGKSTIFACGSLKIMLLSGKMKCNECNEMRKFLHDNKKDIVKLRIRKKYKLMALFM